MTQGDKRLLLKDLCARLPYGIKGLHRGQIHELFTIDSRVVNSACIQVDGYDAWFSVDTFKPYLRSMSSMTEEEGKEWEQLLNYNLSDENEMMVTVFVEDTPDYIDWFNAHHFDYRDLIEKGLALEAPEDMYKQ